MAIGDENVTIRINVKADTRDIDRVRAKLAALCAQAKSCDDTFDGLGKRMESTNREQKRLGDGNDDLRNKLRSVGREANGLSKILKTAYKFAFIGAGIETAALALALSSVNGLLATGRFLVKSYQVVMSGLAKAAAAAGVALATVAAAQRQYVAAQATGRYGGNFAASSMALRTLTGDARLASLGMKTLTGAFNAASKNAPVTGATASALAGLADFAVLSGDIEKGTAALASFITLVQKGGPRGKGVAEAAKELGPEFQKAFNEISKGGKATTEDLMKAFSTGALSEKAGITGTFAATQGTLVGQFKAFTTQAQVMFADLGMAFIGPVQDAFQKLTEILKRTIIQISPILQDFATGGLLDKAVNGVDKVSLFVVKLMRDYVPKTQGFFQSMSRAWNTMTSGFERFGAYLRQFSEASRIMNHFLGQIFGAIGSGLKNNFEAFAKMVVEDRSDFDKFGKSLANLITQIFNLFNAIRQAFMQALPAISAVVNTVAKLVGTIAELIRMIAPLGGGTGLGGMAALMLPMAAGLAFRGRGAGAAGAKGMGAMGKLGVGAGVLGVAGASQIPGVGGAIAPMASAGLLAAMFAPAGKIAGASGGIGSAFLSRGLFGKGSFAMKAGIGAAGAVGTNMLADAAYKKYGTAGSVLAGVGGGAATGAAVAGLPGAIVGGIIGGVVGFTKDAKYKKEARKAAEQFVGQYSSSVEQAIAANDYKTAAKQIDDFTRSAQQMADGQVKSGTAMSKAEELWATTGRQYEVQTLRMIARLNDLEEITGLTKDQIAELATAADINLGDNLVNLQEIMQATGQVVERLGKDFDNYLVDTFSTDIGIIGQTVDKLRAPIVADEIAQAFVGAVKAGKGTADITATGQFIEQIMTQMNLQYGTAGADLALLSMLGGRKQDLTQFGAGAAFLPGGVFGAQGVTPAAFGPQGQQLIETYLGARGQSYAAGTAQNIVSALAAEGQVSTMSVDELTTKLAALPLEKLIQFSQTVAQGGLFKPEVTYTRGGLQYGGQAIPGVSTETQLNTLLSSALGKDAFSMEVRATSDKNMLTASETQLAAANTFSEAVGFAATRGFGGGTLNNPTAGPQTPAQPSSVFTQGPSLGFQSSRGFGNTTTNINVNVTGAAASDPKLTAAEIAREVARLQRNIQERK